MRTESVLSDGAEQGLRRYAGFLEVEPAYFALAG